MKFNDPWYLYILRFLIVAVVALVITFVGG